MGKQPKHKPPRELKSSGELQVKEPRTVVYPPSLRGATSALESLKPSCSGAGEVFWITLSPCIVTHLRTDTKDVHNDRG